MVLRLGTIERRPRVDNSKISDVIQALEILEYGEAIYKPRLIIDIRDYPPCNKVVP